MLRRVRRLLLLAIAAVVAGAIVLVLTSRPTLSDAHRDASKAWNTLRPRLAMRYEAVGFLERSMHAAGPDRDFLVAAREALATWNAQSASSDLSAQIFAANRIEGAARRLAAAATDPRSRYSGNDQVRAALRGVRLTKPPKVKLANADKAVRHYNSVREGAFRSIVAGALGYDEMPRLVIS